MPIAMKIVASNRRARFDYEILETVEAGVMLTGGEAKSCRSGHADLRGAYVTFRNGVPILRKMTIQPYRFAVQTDIAPDRDRPLLLAKKEVERLQSLGEQQGMTIVPTEVRAGRYIKILLAVARGRKTIDKRRKIREKEVSRRLRKSGNEE